MNDEEIRELKRKNRAYKKALDGITLAVSQHLALLDAEMTKPSDNERGQRVARLVNELDMANDAVLHFTFHQSFESINQRKTKMARMAQARQETHA